MTGRYPSRVDITDWIPGAVAKNPKLIAPEDRDYLDLKETTLAEAFKKRATRPFTLANGTLATKAISPKIKVSISTKVATTRAALLAATTLLLTIQGSRTSQTTTI